MYFFRKIFPPFLFLFFILYPIHVSALDTLVTANVNPTTPPLVPEISYPPDDETTHTVSSSITITGNSESFAVIKVYVNGIFAGQTTAANGGAFSISTPLSLGLNNIYVTATNGLGTSPNSNTVQVYRDAVNTPDTNSYPGLSTPPATPPSSPSLSTPVNVSQPPPSPSIESLGNGDETTAYNVVVSGHASGADTVEVYVNGRLVAILHPDESGFYSTLVGLQKGENKITAYSVNKYGKGYPTEITVKVKEKESQKNPITTLFVSKNNLEEILLIICYTLLAILALMSLKKRQRGFGFPKH